MWDPVAKQMKIRECLDEMETEFGGVEYVHIFDWGNMPKVGRVYGRVGDYSPYERLGGVENFRNQIQKLRARGVPVGLYIEGYLVSPNGKLGNGPAKDWQIYTKAQKPFCFANSVEMMMCPMVEEWKKVQFDTYRGKVAELGVDGMYMDQFGFSNQGKDCWRASHKHPVPSSTTVAEASFVAQMRKNLEDVNPSLALYSEEAPCDYGTQLQDGSFSYYMRNAFFSNSIVPLDAMRFAEPTFKIFQILVCDRKTGSWKEGVDWTFFNGDGLWIEGPPSWFAEETRAEIRKCHAILRKYKDAFCSTDVEPLVRTMNGYIFANRFTSNNYTVYALFNARHRAYSGPVMELPKGHVAYDAWLERTPPIVMHNGRKSIQAEIAPRGVSCIVVAKSNE